MCSILPHMGGTHEKALWNLYETGGMLVVNTEVSHGVLERFHVTELWLWFLLPSLLSCLFWSSFFHETSLTWDLTGWCGLAWTTEGTLTHKLLVGLRFKKKRGSED